MGTKRGVGARPCAKRRARPRSHRGDSGSAAVEFAIILPVLLLLVLGVIEFSLLLKDSAGLAATVRVGARTAASGAGAGDGVCAPDLPSGFVCAPPKYSPALVTSAINAMQTAGTAQTPDLIDSVLVYRANEVGWPGTTTNAVDANTYCSKIVSPTTLNDCVKFTYNKVANKFQYTSGGWDSAKINACINADLAQSVGVYMQASHPFVTRLFGATFTLNDKAVMRFEPLPIQSCNGTGSSATGGHS
jgi:hypothetical protein